jgi:molybdopterin-guanine dinucleotide biosynthesis protein A
MSEQNKISGVVLAGGQARRMQRQDKGLVLFKGRPLVSYALAALKPLVDEVLISANRNQDSYGRFGHQVIGDNRVGFDGPLAGVLAAMQSARYPLLLVTPCDTPLVNALHLQRLLSGLAAGADVAAAFDGQRLHPVFMALKCSLQPSLRDYLQSGERKLQVWLRQQNWLQADFSDAPEIFANINTLSDLAALEQARQDE